MIGLACATISCDGFDDNDFRESFRIMPDVGFRYIEFNAWYPSAITPAKMRDLKQRCADRKILPACMHGMGFGAANPRELSKDVAHKLRIIDAALEVGCRRVSFTGAGRGKEGGLDAIITVLREVAPVAEEKNVLICLENHAGNNLENIDDYSHIFEAIDSSHVGICLDTGHFDAAAVDMDALIDRFQLKINHIHVKENKGFGRKEFVRFGQGDTDNFYLIDRMLALGYQGFITVELSPQEDRSTIPADLRLAWQMFQKYETAPASELFTV
jgi:sugar phosphate isomerase/epimerase